MNKPFLITALLGASTCSISCQAGPAQKLTTANPRIANASSEATYGAWRASHIGGGGFLQNVVFTSNPQVLYAYADVVGPWRSDDGGRRWRALFGNMPARGAYGVRALSVDPRNPDQVLVACGSQWTPSDGIYRSSDGGKSWSKVLQAQFYANEAARSAGFLMARHPRNPDEILAASGGDGVFRSRDNGATWQKIGLENLYPTDLRYDQSNPQRIWLSARTAEVWSNGKKKNFETAALFRTDDGGAMWSKVLAGEKDGRPSNDAIPDEMLQDPRDPATLYGIFGSEWIRRSKDGGATWENFSEGLPRGGGGAVSNSRFNALAAGPDFILTASRRGNFFRLNAGETKWHEVKRESITENYEGQEWHAAIEKNAKPDTWQHFGASLGSISIDPRNPNNWWFTDWYAAYQSNDAGKSWNLSMDGIELTVIHAVTQDPSDPGIVQLGMADNGHLLSQNGGARFASSKITSNMKGISLSPALPSRVYGVGNGNSGEWVSNQVFISTDRGRTWTKSPMTGLPDMNRFRTNSIAADPKNPNVVYIAVSGEVRPREGGVYQSTDAGQSWKWMGEGLPGGTSVFRSDIWAIGREIAISPDGSLCAISRDRREAFRFDPATKQWSLADLKIGDVRSVVADVLSPGRFFIAAPQDGVFRSEDSGKTWRKVLEAGAEHVASDAVKKNRVAAGTANGMMLSEDGGATWRNPDPNLPHRFYPFPAFAGDRLIAGTYAAGVYWMPLTGQAARPITARPAPAPVPLPPANPAEPLPPLPALANGDMAEGNAIPTGWSLSKGAQNLVVQRDTGSFKSAPSALLLRSEGGRGNGNTGFALPIVSEAFRMRGHFKMQGAPEEAALAVQVFDKDFKQVGWIQVADFKAIGEGDWKEFEHKVALPGGAAHAFLLLTFKGEGRVWLDDLQITR